MSDSDRSERIADLMQWGGGAATFVVCLVVTWLIAASYGEYDGYAKAQAKQQTNSYADKIEEACAGFAGVELVRCGYEVEKSAAEAERSEYDLEAQREVSLWTFWMMWATGVGIILSLSGLYFLAANLDEMKQGRQLTGEAIKAAHAQAKAAQHANEIAGNDQRPYLYMGDIKNNRTDVNTAGPMLEWTFNVTNHGRTPAIIHSIICEGQLAIDWVNPARPERGEDQKIFVGPSESTTKTFVYSNYMSGRGQVLLDQAPEEVKRASQFMVENQTDFMMFRKNLLLRVRVRYADMQGVMWERSGCWAESKAFRGIQEQGGNELNYERRIG